MNEMHGKKDDFIERLRGDDGNVSIRMVHDASKTVSPEEIAYWLVRRLASQVGSLRSTVRTATCGIAVSRDDRSILDIVQKGISEQFEKSDSTVDILRIEDSDRSIVVFSFPCDEDWEERERP